MLKKTLLKNTTRFLETPFPENLFPYKKKNRKRNLLLYSSKKNFLKIKHFSRSLNLMKAKKHKKILFPLSLLKNKLKKVPKKISDFKKTLQEIKKLSLIYGNLSNTEIKKTLLETKKLHGNNSDNLLLLLESRLDIILYRSLFFSSIQFARQSIRNNEVLVNSKCVNIFSYKVKPADIISVKPKNKKFIAKNILKNLLFKFRLNIISKPSLNSDRKLFNLAGVFKQPLLNSIGHTTFKKASQARFRNESGKNMVLPWTILNLKNISLVSKKLKNFKNKIHNLISTGTSPARGSKFTENFAFLLNTIICTNNSFTSKVNFNKLELNSIFNKTLVMNENFRKIFHDFKFYGFNNISRKKSPLLIFKRSLNISNAKFKGKFNLNKNRLAEKKPHISFQLKNCIHQAEHKFLQNSLATLLFPNLSKSAGKLVPANITQINACTYLEKISLMKKLKFITGFTKVNLNLSQSDNLTLAGLVPGTSPRKFATQSLRVSKLNKNMFFNANILTHMNKFLFRKKHRYIISNFYLKQLQNQISPKNDFLLKHSVPTILKKNKKLAVLLIHLDNLVIHSTKNIISSLLDYGDKYFSYQEKNVLKNTVTTLWHVKRYNIFTFLKLKNLFFYKRIKENKMSNTESCKLMFYKPLNLEISYKTLSIIYLYPSQKLVFPCTVDVQLLLRHTS